ncbi:MAG: hypothetical protein IJG37_05000, partial [Synergistaceae bacterium]|nr:hypothetical protein [Synergistaceae bacterium]
MTGTACGAVSEDTGVYVRKDVFEVYMQNINTKFDMIMEELKDQKQMITDLSNRVSNLSERVSDLASRVSSLSERVSNLSERVANLSGRVDGLDARVNDLRNDIYLGLVVLGIVVSWPKVKEAAQKRAKSASYVTLEDVRRLIEENNARMSGKVQA